MIVGCADVDLVELRRNCSTKLQLMEYAESLVPEEFRHIKDIVDNQCYLCCLTLRKDTKVSWDIKKPVIDDVMRAISITGFTDCLVEVKSLFALVDLDKLQKYNEKGL